MFAFVTGVRPAVTVRARATRVATVAAVLGLAGCASDPYPSTAQNVSPQAVAQAAAEVEADGLPAQTPPPARISTAPDDPSEPFSRNYGGVNPSAIVAPARHESDPPPLHAQDPQIPADLPQDFRRKLVQAMAENE